VTIDANISYSTLLQLMQGLVRNAGAPRSADMRMQPQAAPPPAIGYRSDPSRLEPTVIPGNRPPIGPGRASGLFGLIQPAEGAEDPEWEAMRQMMARQGSGIVVGR
jgi:hypothetical protein